ncbi:hypothetical protein F4803DRAFT_102966 [Xylaria telfairii]|nr:hypothetical protein F4803DRAFT_102966 [Xylaria telfairii]
MLKSADREFPPPTRQDIITTCPGLEASPAQVRAWFQSYLAYRGMELSNAEKIIWRGAELHRASHAALVDAFRQHCGTLGSEAEALGHDVHAIVEGSVPRTLFQMYVEGLFGCIFYSDLMKWTEPKIGFMSQANCVFCWLRFFSIHLLLSLAIMITIQLLVSIW